MVNLGEIWLVYGMEYLHYIWYTTNESWNVDLNVLL